MVDKFQKIFDSMNPNDEVKVSLDYYEISQILAFSKANETFMKSLEENMLKGFDKIR